MGKIFLIVLTFILSGYTSSAQEFSSRVFHKGWLVTEDRDTVRGHVKYSMEANSVQVMIGKEKINTYSSKKILFFEIYDSILKSYRQFYAIPHQIKTDFKAPILFEVLYEGPLSLLVREKIIIASDPYGQTYFNSSAITHEQLSFTYYFVNAKGEMILYTGKKSQLYEILNKNTSKVQQYVKSNKLKTDKMRDLVRIVAFYNSL